ncbi:glucokinase [Limoniibacter endophyticus]|uniref:Glucokinase n=1 Tax=Limoniibacter endophyticus TaxID=1565040 RepID=A0A8J3DGX3_9HYPH|nr:glucokinase [Limoniibacter endophyticus]GHC66446.1 glucokinase [Limoniibacter endophyticus]
MALRFEGDPVFQFPVLIGDIGGTNARFAILVDAQSEPREFPTIQTADFETIEEAIQAGVLDKTSLQPRTTILAVAGPIKGDEIDLTNCPWVVRPNEMMQTLGLTQVVTLNDFEAQALSVIALDDNGLEKIAAGEALPMSPRVVLGPGTGLGVGGLVHSAHKWIPLASEGGHIDIGPRSKRDYAVFPNIETIEGRVAGEQIMCGRGLVNLYRAIAKTDGKEPTFNDPAEISSAGLERTDSVAAEALDMFVTQLGRFAGDLALVFMARGGIYLTGGIAQKILPALKSERFTLAVRDKAPHSAMMAKIPVYAITHPRAPVLGLAAYARTPQRFGVEVSGRIWRA